MNIIDVFMINLDNQDILYSRFTKILKSGEEGLKKIQNGRIAIFGVGGLGSWSALQLIMLGVKYLRLVDRDIVEKSNLPRTPLYNTEDIDYPKVERAKKRLLEYNPQCAIDIYAGEITEETIEMLLHDIDIVIDGLDSLKTRFIVNAACQKFVIPYIFSGALGVEGSISTFLYNPKTPHLCLQCIYGDIKEEELPTCEVTGIHTGLLATIASIQVQEALEILQGHKPFLFEKLLFVYFSRYEYDIINLSGKKTCSLIQKSQNQSNRLNNSTKFKVLELCGNNSYMVRSSSQHNNINISKSLVLLQEKSEFKVITRSVMGATLEYKQSIKISIFKGGNVLIRDVDSKQAALDIFELLSPYLSIG